MRAVLGLFVLVVLAAVLTVQRGWHVSYWGLPAYLDPFEVLRIDDPPNLWTRLKLVRIQRDPIACLNTLATSRLRWSPVAAHEAAKNCMLPDTVRVVGFSGVPALRLSAPAVLTCPLAVSLALYEHHALQPLARRFMTAEVVQIDHLGSFACRNINHVTTGRRSQHAGANALDIAGFRLRSGADVRYLRDWDQASPKSEFLHALQQASCDWFSGVLGPDYNAAHRDHAHLDRGPYRICR